MELAETHKHLISEGCVLWRQCLSRCTQAWLSHTTWTWMRNLTFVFGFFWPHTFKHFCLSSTKNSGPQAWHLLNSRETTNIIFMLRLNPSWGSQSRVDSSVKGSKALWGFFLFLFFLANQVSTALTVCLCVCIAYRHPSAVWFIRSRRYFSNKRVREEEQLWHFNLPHLLLGAGELWKLIGKHLWHSIIAFSKDSVISFGPTKSHITSTISLGARWPSQRPDWLELSTTGKDCRCGSYHWQIWVRVQPHSRVNILALGWKYK